MKYFVDKVEYPREVALDILPWGVLWCYISSTFLDGFVNYARPIKAYLLDRYWDSNEDLEQPITVNLIDPPTSSPVNWKHLPFFNKQELFYKATTKGAIYHTNLGMFGDDVLLLSRIENHAGATPAYIFFWFDMDVSDCCIGRFQTHDPIEEVIEEFSRCCKALSDNDGDIYPMIREIPLHFFQGWISF